MKFLVEGSQYKYFALSEGSSEYYKTLEEVKRDLINFGEENKVVVYKLSDVDEVEDLTSEDIVFEFYDNKIHYPNGKTVSYNPQVKKEFKMQGPDGKMYRVNAYTKMEANRIFKNYFSRL